MLQPRRLTLREITLRLREPFRISSGVTDRRRILLVAMEEASGAIGWSECVAGEAPHYSPETVDTAWLAIVEWLAPQVLGTQFASPEALASRLATAYKGHRMAKAAVEMAAWDLVATREQIPLATLLGGTRTRVEAGISIGIQASVEALTERVAAAAGNGYRRIKLKIRPGADVEFVDAARDIAPDGVPLSVDANSAYTLDDMETLRYLDDMGLLLIEQPLGEDDLVRHATLQRALKTPLCLDESITSLERAQDMVTLGSGRVINIKPGRVGGLSVAKAIHDFARTHDVPVWCGGMLESGIGRAHNVALASLPNFSLPGDLSPSARYWERDIVVPEWTMHDGCLHVPDASGLGVAVDVDYIDGLTQRSTHLDAA